MTHIQRLKNLKVKYVAIATPYDDFFAVEMIPPANGMAILQNNMSPNPNVPSVPPRPMHTLPENEQIPGVYMCLCPFLCIYVVCVSIPMHRCVCVCACVYVCIGRYVCVCVCVRVRVHR